MILELVIFFSAIIISLIFFAESGRHPPLGIIGSIVLLILGLWIVVDGIQYQTSELKMTNSTTTTDGNDTSMESSESISPVYSDLPELPYLSIGISVFLSLSFILASLYMLFNYAFNN